MQAGSRSKIIKSEELEREDDDDMNIEDDEVNNGDKPSFPALSAVDAMVSELRQPSISYMFKHLLLFSLN